MNSDRALYAAIVCRRRVGRSLLDKPTRIWSWSHVGIVCPARSTCLKSTRPDVLLVHLVSGIKLSELREIRSADSRCQIVTVGPGAGRRVRVSGDPGWVYAAFFPAIYRSKISWRLCAMSIKARCVLKKTCSRACCRRSRSLSRNGRGRFLVGGARPQEQGNRVFAGNYRRHGESLSVQTIQKLGMNDRLDMALYGRKNLFSGQLGLERTRDTGPPAVLPSLCLMARKQPIRSGGALGADPRRRAGG
jgi:hypothetical protein